MSMIQEIKLLNDRAVLPVKGSELSACFDLSASENSVLEPGDIKIIGTGISIAWYDENYYCQLLSRSGMSVKGITVRAGVIDIDYRREIKVVLKNESSNVYIVNIGDKIAQYTFVNIAGRVKTIMVEEFSEELESSRKGGFGSTGV